MYWGIHELSVHGSINPPPHSPLKNTSFLFFAKTPLNLQTVQAPYFYVISLYTVVFDDPTSPHEIFLWTPHDIKIFNS